MAPKRSGPVRPSGLETPLFKPVSRAPPEASSGLRLSDEHHLLARCRRDQEHAETLRRETFRAIDEGIDVSRRSTWHVGSGGRRPTPWHTDRRPRHGRRGDPEAPGPTRPCSDSTTAADEVPPGYHPVLIPDLHVTYDTAWLSQIATNKRSEKAHKGFEPVPQESAAPTMLRRRLDELRARSREQARDRD